MEERSDVGRNPKGPHRLLKNLGHAYSSLLPIYPNLSSTLTFHLIATIVGDASDNLCWRKDALVKFSVSLTSIIYLGRY